MRDLLSIIDALTAGTGDRDDLPARLAAYDEAAQNRVDHLRHQLAMAEEFASELRKRRL